MRRVSTLIRIWLDEPCWSSFQSWSPIDAIRSPTENGFAQGSIAYWDSFKHEMWRFQVASQIIAQNIPSFVEFPPMQAGAGFSTGDLKEKVEALIAASHAHGE